MLHSQPAGVVSPFAGLDVPWLLRMRAETRRDHPFLIWSPFDGPARSWSYGEFHDRVGALAAGLAKRGIKPGDFVLVHLDNCIEQLLSWFACAELGAIVVTTNTRSAPSEMSYFAEHCGAVAAITQPAYAGSSRQLQRAALDGGDFARCRRGARAAQLPQRAERFEALFTDSADRPRRPTDPNAPCSVQYTSGTTSRPKAVLWTHANALWGGKVNAVHQTLRPDDVHLAYLPLFHTNALAYSMLATLWVGASCVIQPRFSARRFWNVAHEHRATWTSTIGFCLKALLDHEIPKPQFPAVGHGFLRAGGILGVRHQDHRLVGHDRDHHPRHHRRSRPAQHPDVDRPRRARIRDPRHRRRRHPDRAGWHRQSAIKGIPGLSLFKEYLHNETATRDSFDDHGYFITGDRVTLLQRGFIKFGDRAKDMLKVGGENVAASEIEQVVERGARRARGRGGGKKHPMLDEVPVVFVIRATASPTHRRQLHDAIMAACRDALADFKVPREIRFVDAMPRSTLEKVAKAELRKLLE